jgi:hypothetical protein
MRKLFFILFSFNLFSYDFEISIATVFQNEAPYLKEWIEFHKLIGVEHFYLYNNNSEDHFLEILEPYIESGVVELFDWKERPKTREEWHLIQRKALLDAILRAQNVSKWVAFIDADEFIFPVEDKTLPQFLKNFEEYPAVAANWQVFGTSHINHLKKNRLMIEQLTKKAYPKNSCNALVKSIVQVNFIDTEKLITDWNGVHTYPLKGGLFTVNAYKQPIKDRIKDFAFPLEKIRIHHYKFRDESFFKNIKLKRPDSNGEKTNFLKQCAKTANQVEDRSILIYADELKKVVFK